MTEILSCTIWPAQWPFWRTAIWCSSHLMVFPTFLTRWWANSVLSEGHGSGRKAAKRHITIHAKTENVMASLLCYLEYICIRFNLINVQQFPYVKYEMFTFFSFFYNLRFARFVKNFLRVTKQFLICHKSA
jgi:hypothetical protein